MFKIVTLFLKDIINKNIMGFLGKFINLLVYDKNLKSIGIVIQSQKKPGLEINLHKNLKETPHLQINTVYNLSR